MTACAHPPFSPHRSARNPCTSSYSAGDMGLFLSRDGKEGWRAAMDATCVSMGMIES
jgi:hypothetical protein